MESAWWPRGWQGRGGQWLHATRLKQSALLLHASVIPVSHLCTRKVSAMRLA